jgi:hypothetical protein
MDERTAEALEELADQVAELREVLHHRLVLDCWRFFGTPIDAAGSPRALMDRARAKHAEIMKGLA